MNALRIVCFGSVVGLAFCALAWSQQSHSSHSNGDYGDGLIAVAAIALTLIAWSCAFVLWWRYRAYLPLLVAFGGPAALVVGSFVYDKATTPSTYQQVGPAAPPPPLDAAP